MPESPQEPLHEHPQQNEAPTPDVFKSPADARAFLENLEGKEKITFHDSEKFQLSDAVKQRLQKLDPFLLSMLQILIDFTGLPILTDGFGNDHIARRNARQKYTDEYGMTLRNVLDENKLRWNKIGNISTFTRFLLESYPPSPEKRGEISETEIEFAKKLAAALETINEAYERLFEKDTENHHDQTQGNIRPDDQEIVYDSLPEPEKRRRVDEIDTVIRQALATLE